MRMFNLAVILAGGKGERMKPLTNKIPKALVEYNGQKLIDYGINYLTSNSVNEIYVTYSYLSEILFSKLKNDISGFINTSNKDNCYFLFNSFLNKLNETIIVLPCDIVIDINLSEIENDYYNLNQPAIMIIPTIVKKDIAGDFIIHNISNNCIQKLSRETITNIYASGLQIINLKKINSLNVKFDNFNDLWNHLININELKVSNILPKYWNCFDEITQLNKI